MTRSPKDRFSTDKPQDDSDDAWAAALAEQAAAEPDQAASAPAPAPAPDGETAAAAETAVTTARPAADHGSDAVFKPLAETDGTAAPTGTGRNLEAVMDIPVTLSVELGSTRMSIHDLLDLARGSIVELDGLAGDPMNILVNDHLVAQGEVVVVEDKYGIRITEIISHAERIGKLGR